MQEELEKNIEKPMTVFMYRKTDGADGKGSQNRGAQTEDDVFLEICGDGGMCLYCLFWRLETDDG